MSSHRLSKCNPSSIHHPSSAGHHLTRVAHGERRHKCVFPRCTKSFTRPGMSSLPISPSTTNSTRPTQTTHPVYAQGRSRSVLSIAHSRPVRTVFCHLKGIDESHSRIHDGYYDRLLLPPTTTTIQKTQQKNQQPDR